jgi:hypothetical protein
MPAQSASLREPYAGRGLPRVAEAKRSKHDQIAQDAAHARPQEATSETASATGRSAPAPSAAGRKQGPPLRTLWLRPLKLQRAS